MLISVIIPVYNVEDYLPRCLKSVSEQTYKDLEIIIVDDGSTDSSGALCDEFAARDCRARVIHQQNKGLWAARNTGHDAARGEYLFFPDSDDYFHRDTIRLLYEAINSGAGYDLAICQCKRTWGFDEDISSPVHVRHVTLDRDDLLKSLYGENVRNLGDLFAFTAWNKLYRRSLIENHRNNPYRVAQDRDFLIRLYLRLPKAILVDNVLYYWVQRPTSAMRSSFYPLARSMCLARMNYSNYLALPEDSKRFGHYMLFELYSAIVNWKAQVVNTPDYKTVYAECKTMMDDTWRAFLRSREIPLWKRAAYLFFSRFPRLAGLTKKLI